MFLFGMVEAPGAYLCSWSQLMSTSMISSYRVDWYDINNTHIIGHHNEHNAADISGQDAFVTYQLERPTVVLVPEANCPLTSEQLHWLDSQLGALP